MVTMSFFGGLFNDVKNTVTNLATQAKKTVSGAEKLVHNEITHPPIIFPRSPPLHQIEAAIGHAEKLIHHDITHPPIFYHSPPKNDIINPIEHALGHVAQIVHNDLAKIPGETLSDVQKALAGAYHLTRQGFTDFYTGAGVAGREVGDFIRYHHFVPVSEAIQEVENQSVSNTPIFSFLSRFGIKTGSQLINDASQLASNVIPITGTFGHLAAHPGESLGNKISDVAFGIADLLPGLDVASSLLRPADVGAEAALAGARAAAAGGETATDLANPLLKDISAEGTSLTNPAERDILSELDLEKNAGKDIAGETNTEKALTEDLTSNDLEKGSRLRNSLIKIGKYGTIGAIGIGVGVPFGLSIFGGRGNNQTQTQTTQNTQNQNTQNFPIPSSPSTPSSPSSPSIRLPNITTPNPSSPTNLPPSSTGTTGVTGLNGLYNPFMNGEQAQEAGTAFQNTQASPSPYNLPSSPSVPSSPSSPSSPSGSSEGFLSNLFHNKFFLIGIIVIILVIIGIIIMRR